jgi:hypothetical protein
MPRRVHHESLSAFFPVISNLDESRAKGARSEETREARLGDRSKTVCEKR